MIPGDFRVPKISQKVLLISGIGALGTLVILIIAVLFVGSAWWTQPLFGFDDGPDQPIAFKHAPHVKELGMKCTYCHRFGTEGAAAAAIPPVEFCMSCHRIVGDGNEEIKKIRDAYSGGKPIDWVRVHRLPDHAKFFHPPHIKKLSEKNNIEASEVCSTCHGDVASMNKVKQVSPMKMGWCVDCHRANGASTDCTTCHY